MSSDRDRAKDMAARSDAFIVALWEIYEYCAPGRFGECKCCAGYDPQYKRTHNDDCPVGKVEMMMKEAYDG